MTLYLLFQAQFSTPSFEVKKKAQERASFEKTFKNYKDFEGVEKTLIKALKVIYFHTLIKSCV